MATYNSIFYDDQLLFSPSHGINKCNSIPSRSFSVWSDSWVNWTTFSSISCALSLQCLNIFSLISFDESEIWPNNRTKRSMMIFLSTIIWGGDKNNYPCNYQKYWIGQKYSSSLLGCNRGIQTGGWFDQKGLFACFVGEWLSFYPEWKPLEYLLA